MGTVRDLRAIADKKLFSGAYPEALQLYCALIQLQPLELGARLRAADSLLAMKEVRRATKVYVMLARQAANSGYPLYALVALKILSAIDPQFDQLLQAISEIYAAGSLRVGRGARPAPPDPQQPLPPDLQISEPPPKEKLCAIAESIASNYERSGNIYPDKLPPMPLLSLAPAQDFAAILSAIQLVRVKPDTVIIKEGDPGYSFFVLARGAVKVTKKVDENSETTLAVLHTGSIFGEMALLSSSPRSATVSASTDCDLLEFNRDALTATSNTVAGIAKALSTFTQERLINNLLSTAALFRPLDVDQRRDLMRRFVAYDLDPGVQAIREKEEGRGLFLILRGKMVVSKTDEGQKIVLAELGPGDVFGEISLLTKDLTTATVTAKEKTTVLFLGREYFQRLIEAVPEIRDYVERLGEQRLMDLRLSEVPASRQDLDEDEEAEVLV